MAMRVPVPTGSVVDLTVKLEKPATAEEVNAAVKAAAEGPMKGILCYSEDPLGVDRHHRRPTQLGLPLLPQTRVMGDLVKIISWYDNEWGYSSRTADLIAKIGGLGSRSDLETH